MYNRIVISSGHSLHVRGASGVLDEVNEARKVVNQLASELHNRGVDVHIFHDDASTSQNQNLNNIVNFHNSQTRDLDISVHFNAYQKTSKPMGTEVLYVSQKDLASKISSAIASNGFINRGAKKRTDLFFLNNTKMPAVLLEVCFVDSEADASIYKSEFNNICDSIADVLGGIETVEVPVDEIDEIDEIIDIPPSVSDTPHVNIQIEGDVIVTINGEEIGTIDVMPLPPLPTDGLFYAKGKCSYFGGPDDMGVSSSEGLAFIYNVDDAPQLFLPSQPQGSTGLARRLNPYVHYVACRWDYAVTPKNTLTENIAMVRATKTGISLRAFPADWGPHERTNRVADLSPSLMLDLGIETDDEVEVIYPYMED
jgi:N-acetylmuramoyl-L-alanine amidase